ncbi:MAG: hypothetical protein K9L24_01425 [Spirochaetia bacterium]|nr:hypothetical protein [Spirochaetia bacterium]MCF7946578.1 hypothetical protein [Spirochaetia bacterium]MCF7952922.1 hypothetical protein [Spirochaetales bacterium]
MFEHMYGQEQTAELLRQEIINHELPQALLFYGERYTGRMTAALEVSRILACRESGYIHCQCENCRKNRLLEYPYTIVFPNRDFNDEIYASVRAYETAKSSAAKERLAFSVRMLMRRFDPLFSDKSESMQKQLDTLMETLEEDLQVFLDTDDRFEKDQKKQVKKILNKADKLVQFIKSDNISVKSIRKIFSWLHTKPKGTYAVIIFEGIDNFVNASKNAMLKMLEEPPDKVVFILLSEGKGRILSTILSRVRKYYFKPRSSGDTAKIINEVYYQDPDEFDSLRTFFLTQKGLDCRAVREQSEYILDILMNKKTLDITEFEKIAKKTDEASLMLYIFQEIISILQENSNDAMTGEADLAGNIQFSNREKSIIIRHINHYNYLEQTMNQKQSFVLESWLYDVMGELEGVR